MCTILPTSLQTRGEVVYFDFYAFLAADFHFVSQAGFELVTLLSHFPNCWDYCLPQLLDVSNTLWKMKQETRSGPGTWHMSNTQLHCSLPWAPCHCPHSLPPVGVGGVKEVWESPSLCLCGNLVPRLSSLLEGPGESFMHRFQRFGDRATDPETEAVIARCRDRAVGQRGANKCSEQSVSLTLVPSCLLWWLGEE